VPAKEHFIKHNINQLEIDQYLAKELRRAGYGGVEVHKTPLGTRVVIYAARPGMVIGRAGQNVKNLTEVMETKFGLENPQIEVNEIETPELNPRVMAAQLAMRLEKGDHFRRAAYSTLRRIMASGAKGVEITISGKLTSQRAKYQKFRDGVIAKAGDPAEKYVVEAVEQAMLNPGVMGVKIKIMLPDAEAFDQVIITAPEPSEEVVETPSIEPLEEQVENAEGDVVENGDSSS